MKGILILLFLSSLSLVLILSILSNFSRPADVRDLIYQPKYTVEDGWIYHPLTELPKYHPLPSIVMSPDLSRVCVEPQVVQVAAYTQAARPLERRLIRNYYKNVTGDTHAPIFPLGRTTLLDFDQALVEEQRQYGDLLVGDFPETYEYLATKTTMLANFFEEYCQNAKFLIKHDMDVIVNWPQLHLFLSRAWDLATKGGSGPESTLAWETGLSYIRNKKNEIVNPAKDPLWMGWTWDAQNIIHDPKSKNFEPEYPERDYYPPYVAGPSMIFNHPFLRLFLARRLTSFNGYFRNEDAMFGLVMEMTGVAPIQNNQMIPFVDSGWREGACGPNTSSIRDCRCDQWITYHIAGISQEWFKARRHVAHCLDEIYNATHTTLFPLSTPIGPKDWPSTTPNPIHFLRGTPMPTPPPQVGFKYKETNAVDDVVAFRPKDF